MRLVERREDQYGLVACGFLLLVVDDFGGGAALADGEEQGAGSGVRGGCVLAVEVAQDGEDAPGFGRVGEEVDGA